MGEANCQELDEWVSLPLVRVKKEFRVSKEIWIRKINLFNETFTVRILFRKNTILITSCRETKFQIDIMDWRVSDCDERKDLRMIGCQQFSDKGELIEQSQFYTSIATLWIKQEHKRRFFLECSWSPPPPARHHEFLHFLVLATTITYLFVW